MPRLKIAIVGCGAVTRASLLPALAAHEDFEIVALVDRDLSRARELARLYQIPTALDDAGALTRDAVDGVVLATPPAHHGPAARDLAAKGFHVFVEKPLAIAAAEAEAMVHAAAEAGVRLSVGQFRRMLPAARLLRSLVESEHLGRPLSVDIEEGGEYTWQLATLAVLTRDGGGGGVLIDLGSHVIDQLLFVLPGEPELVSYADNARGGIETDCELRFNIQSRWGAVPCRLELSRTRTVRNTVRINCERGTLELRRPEFCRVHIEPAGAPSVDPISGQVRPITLSATWSDEPALVGYQAFRNEFDDWREAIVGNHEPQLSGASVLPTVRLIDQCYRSPQLLAEPWTATSPVVHAPRTGRVLVTGAGGFLGCRTVELLRDRYGWEIRALVRRPSSAARLAQSPIDIVVGDVTSAEDVRRALDGCDAVVHCAVGTGWPPESAFTVTVDGTKTVGEEARRAGVRRFVHVSSMAVHGDRPPARLDESCPLHEESGFSYSRAKFLAERAIEALVREGLPAVSLRPTRIYGPFSKTFTVRPIQAIAERRFALSGDADSPANMIYVDNVVGAIAAALEAPASIHGEAMLLNDPDQLSWYAFYEYFAAAAGSEVQVVPYRNKNVAATDGLATRWIKGLRQVATSPEVRALAKRVMATDPIGVLPRRVWERSPGLQRRALSAMGVDEAVVYRPQSDARPELVEFRIEPTLVVADKAARILGVRPVVEPAEAMRRTLEWAKSARLLGNSPVSS